eukprot:COSAG02_NODE_472_length_21636_cov_767.911366_2_plen_261_part_00
MAFERRIDGLCREIGTRGQHHLEPPEAVPPTRVRQSSSPPPTPAPHVPKATPEVPPPAPAPAPVPALAAAAAAAVAPAELTMTNGSMQQPTLAPLTTQSMSSASSASGAAGAMDVSVFLDLAERMQAKADEQKAEWQAEAKAQLQEIEAKLDATRQETVKLRQEAFAAQMPQEVISTEQVEALMARLEALHGAQLLSDDELFVIEDAITDFAEARAKIGVVTMDVVHAWRCVGTVHKLVAVSEAVPRDAMLARQLRRKFV